MTSNLKLQPAGRPYPLGMHIHDEDLIFSGCFKNETGCGIMLYPLNQKGEIETGKGRLVQLTDTYRTGFLYCVTITGGANRYGAYQLVSGGRRYADPFSLCVRGLEDPTVYVDEEDIYSVICRNDYNWSHDRNPRTPLDRSFIYLLHVRGYTMTDTRNVPARERGTYTGLIRKIPYLKSLGVTAVELMPVHEQPGRILREGITAAHRSPKGSARAKAVAQININGVLKDADEEEYMTNYWGFEDGFLFAPRSAYAMKGNDPCEEFKGMVKAFHKAGIEVILQMFFPDGTTHQQMEEAMRSWVCNYHIDGIHLKGQNVNSTLLAEDPLLSDTKIFDYGFDYGKLYKGIAPNPARRNLAQYKDDFCYTARHFLKGDDCILSSFLTLSQETGVYGGCVHFIANYDGLRLADLVSFEHKNNEANGEKNADGLDDNVSWNCGIEGKTRRKSIVNLRNKQIRNALAILMLSQGTPMLFGGDEFGNSQDGNNNPYCQDNPTGWIDWKCYSRNEDLVRYVKELSSLRNKYSMFRSPVPYRLMDYKACSYPDFSYHGTEAWRPDLTNYSHTIGMLYCGLYSGRGEEQNFIYVAFNMHWEAEEFAIPTLPEGCKWQLALDTSSEVPESGRIHMTSLAEKNKKVLEPRSICVFISKGSPEKKNQNEPKKQQ